MTCPRCRGKMLRTVELPSYHVFPTCAMCGYSPSPLTPEYEDLLRKEPDHRNSAPAHHGVLI